MKKLTVYTELRQLECVAKCFWDKDSYVLSFIIDYPHGMYDPKSDLQQQIDSSVGIKIPEYNLLLGGIELCLNELRQVTSIDVRSNPSNWKISNIDEVAEDAQSVWLDFQVVFDENAHCFVDLDYDICFDPKTKQLAFVFQSETQSEWYGFADNAYIGLDSNHQLVSLKFSNINSAEFS